MTDTATSDRLAAITERYPRPVTLRDDSAVELRLMGPGDRDRVLQFARALPADDLLFLRINITEESAVDEWLDDIDAGRTTTVLVYDGDRLIGDGSLHHTATDWTRHLGEIRLLLGPEARGRGLGRILADEICAVAKLLELRMLTARMTFDQQGAIAIFRRLGFQREAVLTDYVIGADGETRDLLVATRRL